MSLSKKNNTPTKKDISTDLKVQFPPNDTVATLNWSPVADYFVVACWDGEVRVYQVHPNLSTSGVASYKHEGPVLVAKFSPDGNKIVSGGGDKKIIVYDLVTKKQSIIGQHNDSISGIDFYSPTNFVTSSWDKTLKYWDLTKFQMIGQNELPDKIYKLSIAFPLMVAAVGSENFAIYDLNNPGTLMKVMTPNKMVGIPKTLQAFSGATPGFMYGISKGKGAVVHIDEKYSDGKDKKDVTFRCNRDEKYCYTIHQVLSHPNKLDAMYALGSDGGISTFDLTKKVRICSMFHKGKSITAGGFDRNGFLLAYATGYDWSRGYKYHKHDDNFQIFLHQVQPEELNKQ
ncbi:WD40 repeat-like protein [Neoconidiobolus thromboides FSU 785]|nr:WD40 repeat-like protein [Neoconidiobolus thromboides FSU 785]